MRILNPSCGFTSEAHGGGARYEYLFANGMSEKRHLVDTVRYPFRGAGKYPLAWSTIYPVIANSLRDNKYDILRCHSPAYLGPACVLARSRYGIPLVTHVHHWEPILAPLEKWVLRNSDLVIVDSMFVFRQIQRAIAGPTPRTCVVYCGVKEPGPLIGEKMSVNHYYKPVKFAITIGPVIARKRPLELVELWSQVAGNPHLFWIGDGPLHGKAHRLASKLGIDKRVFFVKGLDDAGRDHMLRSADLFVFMSRLEGCPLAVLEAMAAGLPIVATDQGPMPDIIGHKQAVPEQDMVRAIEDTLRDPGQAGYANRLQWESRHTISRWLDAIERAYAQVVR